MLLSLRLRNYRGFADHQLEFREKTIIVGRNNAGKSTIVEALRLISLVTSRFPNLNFRDVPKWAGLPKLYRGVSPDISREGFNFDSVFHRYGEPPATVSATFSNLVRIDIHIGGPEALHAVVFDAAGKPIGDKARARQVEMQRVAILPQVRPLVIEEEVLNDEYVRRTQDSPLSSSHFRNQLRLNPGEYRVFRGMVEMTWPGVRIREFETVPGPRVRNVPTVRSTISLLVQNDDFVAEAGSMGHGLQMWLQTMWFLARTSEDATVVLDEPDVYMHPDLQRRLLRIVSKRHKQTVIATHSTEIVSDVGPESILVVDRALGSSRFASSVPEVQRVIDSLGAVQNLSLARLWSARRFLIVEGHDLELMAPLHQLLFPDSTAPLQTIPHGAVGGWGGWERAVGAAQAMRQAFGTSLSVYCIFDSDYYPSEAIDTRYVRAKTEKLELHVWGRKEIENYLLVPEAISRLISERSGNVAVGPGDVVAELERVFHDLRTEVTSAMVDVLHASDKSAGPGAAFKRASGICDSAYATASGRMAIVSGKEVLSRMSAWSQRIAGVSFSPVAIARELRPNEVPSELQNVLTAIEGAGSLDRAWRTAPAVRAAP